MKIEIEITVQGGVVQEVNAPAGVTIIVKDYDLCEGPDPDDPQDNVIEDENGDYYERLVWEF